VIRAGLIIVLLSAAAPAAWAQDVLTPGEMQAAAQVALAEGQWTRAEVFARALLQRDPDDPVGLAVLARLALSAGASADAANFGRDLFANAPDAAARLQAARLVALAQARQERWLSAAFWLRRATLFARDDSDLALLSQDLRALREASPVSLSLSFSLAPSANVNGGAEDALNVVDGLPFVGQLSPDARALSGWAGTGNARLTYRLREGPRSRTNLSVDLFARAVWLSDAARDFIAAESAPDDAPISGRNFSSAALTVELAHQVALQGGVGQVDLSWRRQYSGQEDRNDGLTLGALRRFDMRDGQVLDLSLSREWRIFDSGQADEVRDRLALAYSLPVGDDSLSLSASLSQTETDNANAAATGWSVNLGYDLAEPVGPFELSFQIGYQFADFADYRVILPVPGGRQDETWSARLSAAIPGLSQAGFSPVISVGWDGTDSNVSRFTRDGWSVDVSLRSSF
jgi:hypothetical protein